MIRILSNLHTQATCSSIIQQWLCKVAVGKVLWIWYYGKSHNQISWIQYGISNNNSRTQRALQALTFNSRIWNFVAR